MVLIPVLFILDNHGWLPKGIVKEEIGEDFNILVFADQPVEKIAVEKSDVLSLNHDSFFFVVLFLELSKVDFFFEEIKRKLIVGAGNDDSRVIFLFLREEVDHS